jgi:hypothetical protein
VVLGTAAARDTAHAAGVTPELFAAGTISTRDDEFGIAFAPDGRTAWFTKRSPTTNTPPRSVICVTHLVDGHWSEPQVAPFSGTWNDFGSAVSADGNRIVFASDRPGETPRPPSTFDIWQVERNGENWSEPRNLAAVNTDANEAYPSLAGDDTLYFASGRPGGKGSSDLWRARWIDGHYTEPENLGGINTEGYESQPAISADQSTLVFASIGRADMLATAGAPYPRADLYVSFRVASGWSESRHLGAGINSPFNETTPYFSPDGLWLYFASDRSFVSLPMRKGIGADEYEKGLHGLLDGWGNIYRVPNAAIASLRPSAEDARP